MRTPVAIPADATARVHSSAEFCVGHKMTAAQSHKTVVALFCEDLRNSGEMQSVQ